MELLKRTYEFRIPQWRAEFGKETMEDDYARYDYTRMENKGCREWHRFDSFTRDMFAAAVTAGAKAECLSLDGEWKQIAQDCFPPMDYCIIRIVGWKASTKMRITQQSPKENGDVTFSVLVDGYVEAHYQRDGIRCSCIPVRFAVDEISGKLVLQRVGGMDGHSDVFAIDKGTGVVAVVR